MEDILVFAIRFVTIWFITAPIVTLLHELGHAIAALLLTGGNVRVWLGSWDQEPHFNIGRLYARIAPLGGFTGFYNYDAGNYGPAARAIIILSGPATSLLLVIGALGFGTTGPISETWLGSNLIVLVGYPAIGQLFVTAIPMRYPAGWGEYAGMASDGLRLIRLFRDETQASVKS